MIHATIQMSLKCIILSQRSQTQRLHATAFDSLCTTPFLRHSGKGKTNWDRKQVASYEGLEVEVRNDNKATQGNLGEKWNCSAFGVWWGLHDCMHVSKQFQSFTEFYT